MGELAIYQSNDGSEVLVRLEGNTLWLTQRELSELLQTSTENIGSHLKNVYANGELTEPATTKDFLVVQTEGQRTVSRKTKHYNLDAIISVGYRVNSKRGTQFRQWATKVLRNHLIRGWSLDRARFERNATELEAALALIRQTAQSPDLAGQTGRGLIEVVTRYTQTFLLLQRFDAGLLAEPKGTQGGAILSLLQARRAIDDLKMDLLSRGEATELFGLERDDTLGGILGNLEQSVFGRPAYPTIECKAAHLLYFVIKDHPLIDGNKRSGAFLFVDFLNRNDALMRDGQPVINDTGLAALALLVAASLPAQKETMILLIENMLTGLH